jgi:hypothetical protein
MQILKSLLQCVLRQNNRIPFLEILKTRYKLHFFTRLQF